MCECLAHFRCRSLRTGGGTSPYARYATRSLPPAFNASRRVVRAAARPDAVAGAAQEANTRPWLEATMCAEKTRVDAHRQVVTAQPIGVEVAGRVIDHVPHPAAGGVEGARVMRGVASAECWQQPQKVVARLTGVEATGSGAGAGAGGTYAGPGAGAGSLALARGAYGAGARG